MKKFQERLAQWVFVGFFTLVWLLLIVGFVSAAQRRGLDSGDAAGWAQAFGAMLSVGASVALVFFTIQRQETEAKRRKEALKDGMLLLADRISMLIESINDGKLFTSLIQVHVADQLYKEYIKHIQSEIRAVEAILDGVTLDKLAEAGIVDSGLYLRQTLAGIHTKVSSGFQTDPHSGIPVNETKAHFQHMKNFVKLADDILMGKTPSIVNLRRRTVAQGTVDQHP